MNSSKTASKKPIKKVCYVLMIAQQFPKGHPKEGKPTNFNRSIQNGSKCHTVRLNYLLWRKRFKKIDAGEAYISLRKWTEKPYQSKMEELFRMDKTTGLKLEKLLIKNTQDGIEYFVSRVDSSEIEDVCISDLSRNDGLCIIDFSEWFSMAFSKKVNGPYAIIHFDNYTYSNSFNKISSLNDEIQNYAEPKNSPSYNHNTI